MSLLPLSYHSHARQPPQEPYLPSRTSQLTDPVEAVDERCRTSRHVSPATTFETGSHFVASAHPGDHRDRETLRATCDGQCSLREGGSLRWHR